MNKKQTQQRKQLWKQVLSILLAVTLVVTSLYLPADAAAVEELPEDTEDSFIDRLADALGIEESENETSEAAAGEAQFSGLEADGLPVEQLKTDEIPEEEVAPEAMILSEVEDEREEDSKTFLMSDGNFLVAQYGETIHYEDADGNWEEIDIQQMIKAAVFTR